MNANEAMWKVTAESAAEQLSAAQARIGELEREREALVFAAHMPADYEFGLPSWVCQVLYAAYIGAIPTEATKRLVRERDETVDAYAGLRDAAREVLGLWDAWAMPAELEDTLFPLTVAMCGLNVWATEEAGRQTPTERRVAAHDAAVRAQALKQAADFFDTQVVAYRGEEDDYASGKLHAYTYARDWCAAAERGEVRDAE